MILTYKVKHGQNFNLELTKARQVAEYAVSHRGKLSSKSVKEYGLKSVISNQVLRKYSRSLSNDVKNVKLTLPGCACQMIDGMHGIIYISALGLYLKLDKLNQLKHISQVNHLWHLMKLNQYGVVYKRIAQIELDDTYAYIGVEVEPLAARDFDNKVSVYISRGKVTCASKRGKVIKANLIGHCNKDMINKASRRIVNFAVREKAVILLPEQKLGRPVGSNERALETKNYRKYRKASKELIKQVEYKALLSGVPIKYIADIGHQVSRVCSKCGKIVPVGDRFTCSCGHSDSLRANAAFNLLDVA